MIKCRNCGEEYDPNYFPVCPFCLEANDGEDYQSDPETKWSACEGQMEAETIEVAESPELLVNNDDSSTANEQGEIESVADTPGNIANISDDTRIDTIDSFSNRTKNVLKRNGILTFIQLKEFVSQNDVSMLHNAGAKTVAEISSVVENPFVVKKEKTIADAFPENRFNKFVTYCKYHNLTTITDLHKLDENELINVRGLGTTKILEIIDRLNELLKEDTQKDESINEVPVQKVIEKTFTALNGDLLNVDISFMLGMGIKEGTINKLRRIGIETLSDLADLPRATLYRTISEGVAGKITDFDELFQKPIIEVVEEVFSWLSSADSFKMTLKKSEGYTLQVLGDEYGLTRERIRQIISKFNRLLTPVMTELIKPYTNEYGFVRGKDLLDIYDNDDYDKIIIYWCKHSGCLQELGFAESFITLDQDKSVIINALSEILDNTVGEGVLFDAVEEEIIEALEDDGLQFIDSNDFISFAEVNGYKKYNRYLVKKSQSYGYLCARLISKYYPEGFKLHDHLFLDQLREYAKEEYGDIRIPAEDRPFSARLAAFTVLRGRGTVVTEDEVKVEMLLIDTLKQYIDDMPQAEIYYSELFARNEGIIRMLSNIDNHHFLHGVLKLYCSDDYDFSQRDYLKKRGDNLNSGLLSERIRLYINETRRPLTKKEIKNAFPGLTDIVLSLISNSESAVCRWDFSQYYSMDLVAISPEEKAYLKQTIETLLEIGRGYCNNCLLYEYVKQDKPEIIGKNEVKTAYNLYFLCYKLFSKDFSFDSPDIIPKDKTKHDSLKTVISDYMGNPSEFDYDDYIATAEALMWTGSRASIVFNVFQEDYIRVSRDKYIKKSCFQFENAVQLEHEINKKMAKGYVSLLNFDCFDEFPDCGYDWNAYLLRSLVDIYCDEYKVIDTSFSDRRYEKGIIVSKYSSINSYEDVVVAFLNRMDIHQLTENEMLSLLIVNNLAYKVIPFELFHGERIRYKDELFYLD